MQRRPMPRVEHSPPRIFKGGLDLVTPTLSLPPGFASFSLNFECLPTGGYGRVKGYERYDGRTSPSAGNFTLLQLVSFVNTPTLGQTVTGQTSAATGVITGIGANYICVTKITGAFTSSEVIKVGATTIGTLMPLTVALSALETAQQLYAVSQNYRTDITAVGGASSSGPVLGVFVFNNIVHAFRNNAAGTAAELWKSTVGGWVKIVFKNEVKFTLGGATQPAEGTTLTQGAVTAVIRRVVTATGAWGANTAAGSFIIENPAGGNFAGGAATIGGINVTLSGIQTAITLLPSGKYEISIGNLAGSLSTLRAYGVDGVNRMWEFDGTYFVPISTGLTVDNPRHLAIHRNTYLMVSKDTSMFVCESGFPYRWATGAEIAVGDTITSLEELPGSQQNGALGVYCKTSMFVLYGTSIGGANPFNLVSMNVGSGAIEYSLQNFSQTYFFNSEGLSSLQTTLNFGNFTAASLTTRVNPFVILETTKVNASTISRQKNQYRIFFNDGYALYVTIVNNKLLGCMPVLFPSPVNVAWESELSTGEEVIFVGCADGFLYQLEKGTSFDGGNIDAIIVTAWDHLGSPRILKGFKHASLELRSDTYVALDFSYQLGYGTPEIPASQIYNTQSFTTGFSLYDVFTWDQFTWDGTSLTPSELDMPGSGENVQVTFASSTPYIDEYRLSSIIYHYTNQRALR